MERTPLRPQSNITDVPSSIAGGASNTQWTSTWPPQPWIESVSESVISHSRNNTSQRSSFAKTEAELPDPVELSQALQKVLDFPPGLTSRITSKSSNYAVLGSTLRFARGSQPSLMRNSFGITAIIQMVDQAISRSVTLNKFPTGTNKLIPTYIPLSTPSLSTSISLRSEIGQERPPRHDMVVPNLPQHDLVVTYLSSLRYILLEPQYLTECAPFAKGLPACLCVSCVK